MIAWLALLGCDGGDTGGETADPCFADEPIVDIGTGDEAWVDLNPGDGVTMIHGPQGGWHMLASVRVGHTLDIVRLHYTITDTETGATVSDNTYDVALKRDQECSGYYTGMYGYLSVHDIEEGDLDTPPELLAYNDVVIRIEATDDEGRTAVDEITVVAVPDPADM